MERWVWFAIASMAFAGFTSVIAKLGLQGISGELGLTIRTIFVGLFVFVFAALAVRREEFQNLTWANFGWLALSGLTTAGSWIFYYKALSEGDVSTIALIDKGSFVVAVFLAWLILGEAISWRVLLGGGLILTGLFVVAKR